jgi:hypothetical protein
MLFALFESAMILNPAMPFSVSASMLIAFQTGDA